jgi:hypothetical protein
MENKGVSPHGNGRVVSISGVGVLESTRIVIGPEQSLEVMSMEMERMLSRVQVVHYDLDDLILLQNEAVSVISVH